MLPPKIASEICSLLPGKDRLTVSVIFKVNAHTGAVSDEETWIGKSIIKSSGKLTYKEVDAVLSGHLDTKLDGADVNQIQILHVSIHFTFFACSILTNFRRWHKNGVSSVSARTERQLLH
jgi:exoribonuclease R